jgi:hypothetical protein
MKRLIVPISLCLLNVVDPTFAIEDTQAEGDGTAEESRAIEGERTTKADPRDERASQKILTPQQWQQLDRTINRGFEFLATQQQQDGSFRGPPAGQPAITSLCVLAFLSRGHLPGEGPYGKRIDRGVDFVLACQGADGVLFNVDTSQERADIKLSRAGIYNHGIAGFMLGEVYGMTDARQEQRVREAILKAIAFTRKHQKYRKDRFDKGGWRYLDKGGWQYRRYTPGENSDLSVTYWQLMFLRSARNAEFEVPKQCIDEAMAYVRRSFDPNQRAFVYRVTDRRPTTAVASGGIVSLSLAGEHQTEMAQSAGEWILTQSFDDYNRISRTVDRYHYDAFCCSQAMFQLGGEYWAGFYPRLARTLVRHQRPDGSWDAEANNDRQFGNIYTTALTILALTPPYQILPIYQR